MEAMEQQRYTIETFMEDAFLDLLDKFAATFHESKWWAWVAVVCFPILLLAILLIFILIVILVLIAVCVRLAVTHADRVVFVLAASFLSFYQVPRKVFYIYIAILACTGFLQFLRYPSAVRELFLLILSWISCGTSNMVLRKFTTLHYSNPFNRCQTNSKVIYVPIGLEIPNFHDMQVFDFPVAEHLDFDKIVGVCRIKIETLNNVSGGSTTRFFTLNAPWGRNRFTVNMENDNLGRLISYFNRVIETDCKELICRIVMSGGVSTSDDLEALSIFGVIKHFNSRLQLVKLELHDPEEHYIN